MMSSIIVLVESSLLPVYHLSLFEAPIPGDISLPSLASGLHAVESGCLIDLVVRPL